LDVALKQRGPEKVKKLVNQTDHENLTPLVACLLSISHQLSLEGPEGSWKRGLECVRTLLMHGADAAAAFVSIPSVARDPQILRFLLYYHHSLAHGGSVEDETDDAWKVDMYENMFTKEHWMKMVQACVHYGWADGLIYVAPTLETLAEGQDWIYFIWQAAADAAMHCAQWVVASRVLQTLSEQPCLRRYATRQHVLELLLACLGCQPPFRQALNEEISRCSSILLQRLREYPFIRQDVREEGGGNEMVDAWIDVAEIILRIVPLEAALRPLQALVLDAGFQPLDAGSVENEDTSPAAWGLDSTILRQLSDDSQLSLLLANSIWNRWTNLSYVLLLSLTALAEALATQADPGTDSHADAFDEQGVLGQGQMMAVIAASIKAAAQTADVRMLERLLKLDATYCNGAVRAALVVAALAPCSLSSDHLLASGLHKMVRCTRMNIMENVEVLALAACSDSPTIIGLLLFGVLGDGASKDAEQDTHEHPSFQGGEVAYTGSVEAVVAASSRGNVHALLLLDRAARIQGDVADAALYLSCLAGSENCVQFLLARDASPDACLNISRAILRLSMACRQEPKLLLHLTQCQDLVTSSPRVASAECERKNQELCRDIVLDVDTQLSALAASALLGHLACARQLLAHNADPNLSAEPGSLHPVAAAASGAKAEMLVLLIASGGHVNAHADRVQLVLKWEKAHRHMKKIMQTIKAKTQPEQQAEESLIDEIHEGSVMYEPPPASFFRRHVHHSQTPQNDGSNGVSSWAPLPLQKVSANYTMSGKRVPMTALIAAGIGCVTAEGADKEEYSRVCRVLVEAGADKQIAAQFFRSECFAACLGDQFAQAYASASKEAQGALLAVSDVRTYNVMLYDPTDILKRSQLFADIEEEDLQTLSLSITLKKLMPGTDLIRMGTISQSLYTVLRGSLSVIIGGNIEVATIKGGGMVGEMSMLTGAPAGATCRAKDEGCEVLEIKKDVMIRLLRQRSSLRDHIDAIITERLATNASKTAETTGLGLKWASIGSLKPSSGKEIINERLEEFLVGARTTPVELSRSHFDQFQVSGLTYDCFICVEGSYFIPEKPACTEEAPASRPTAAILDAVQTNLSASGEAEDAARDSLCLPPHHRVQAVAVTVGWHDQALKKIEFVSGLSRKDLRRMRVWSSIPEPETSKFFVVLPDSGTFIRQVEIVVGLRSILAIRFTQHHADNTETISRWYGQPEGTSHSPFQRIVALTPRSHREFCGAACFTFEDSQEEASTGGNDQPLDIDKVPDAIGRLRLFSRLRCAAISLREYRAEAQEVEVQSVWKMRISPTCKLPLPKPAPARPPSVPSPCTQRTLGGASRCHTTMPQQEEGEDNGANSAEVGDDVGLEGAQEAQEEFSLRKIKQEVVRHRLQGRARQMRPHTAPVRGQLLQSVTEECSATEGSCGPVDTRARRIMEQAHLLNPPGVVTVLRTGRITGVRSPAMESYALKHRTQVDPLANARAVENTVKSLTPDVYASLAAGLDHPYGLSSLAHASLESRLRKLRPRPTSALATSTRQLSPRVLVEGEDNARVVYDPHSAPAEADAARSGTVSRRTGRAEHGADKEEGGITNGQKEAQEPLECLPVDDGHSEEGEEPIYITRGRSCSAKTGDGQRAKPFSASQRVPLVYGNPDKVKSMRVIMNT